MSFSSTNKGQGVRVFFFFLFGCLIISVIGSPVSDSVPARSPRSVNPLVAGATSIYMAVKDGKFSSDEGRRRGQYLIQANKDSVNRQIISSIGGK